MKVMITRKSGNLSDSLKDYIDKKVSELDRRFPNIVDAHVLIDTLGHEHMVDITMRVARRTLVAKLPSSNLRAAVDGCVDKLDKQLDKVKGKYRKRIRKAGQPGTVAEGDITEEAFGMDNEEDNLTLLTIDKDEIILETEERTGTAD